MIKLVLLINIMKEKEKIRHSEICLQLINYLPTSGLKKKSYRKLCYQEGYILLLNCICGKPAWVPSLLIKFIDKLFDYVNHTLHQTLTNLLPSGMSFEFHHLCFFLYQITAVEKKVMSDCCKRQGTYILLEWFLLRWHFKNCLNTL